MLFCIDQIGQRVRAFWERDTIVQITDKHKEELAFPAVTFCNFNRVFNRWVETFEISNFQIKFLSFSRHRRVPLVSQSKTLRTRFYSTRTHVHPSVLIKDGDPTQLDVFRHLMEISRPNYTGRHSLLTNPQTIQRPIDSYILSEGKNFRLSEYLLNYGWQLTEESLLSCQFRNWTCTPDVSVYHTMRPKKG